MKKKIKLSLTVFTMVVSILCMSFGVYSATNVALTISSYISYVAPDIYVTIESVDIYKGHVVNSTVVTHGSPLASNSSSTDLFENPDSSWMAGSQENPLVLDSSNPYLIFKIIFTNNLTSLNADIKATVVDIVTPNNFVLANLQGVKQTLINTNNTPNAQTLNDAPTSISNEVAENTTNTANPFWVVFKVDNLGKPVNGQVRFSILFARVNPL